MIDFPLIEQQHQGLLRLFKKLNDAVKNNDPRNDIFQIIDEVIAFTRLHFETEEQLMIQSGYADVEWHKNKHQELIQDALKLKGKLAYVGEEMFTDWLNHWPFARVQAHIQYADKQFEDLILQRDQK
jgi:hemerythrin